MISPPQARALRAIIIDALTVGVPSTVQSIPADRVVWAGRMHPVPDAPFALLQVIAAEQLDLDGERMHAPVAGVLVETVRTTWDVTVSLQLATRELDDAPSLAHNAWILARRVATRLRSGPASDALSAVGTGIQRSTGIRDLSRFTGSQPETRVAIDLVLRIAVLDSVEPGWIERVTGTGTLDVDGSPSLAVPFEGTEP